MLKCIVIEDQPPAQRILRKFISEHDQLHLSEVFADVFAAGKYLNTEQVDLMFLDIHLPKLSGIDFLKSLPKHPMVIMTTAFPDYALESYEFNVIDYLLKPFSIERFNQSISKTLSVKGLNNINVKEVVEESIVIKSGYDLVNVPLKSILMIKSDADYTEVICSEKSYLSSEPLRYWKETLEKEFCQVHKSYIVNLSCVSKVSHGKVHFGSDHVVPIGRAYKKQFMERYGG